MGKHKGWRYVWRLENEEGVGPWHSGILGRVYKSDDHGGNPSERPGPYSEEGTRLKERWYRWDSDALVFGFRSLRQFRRWFSNSKLRLDLLNAGLRLVRYRVPIKKVWDGNWQVAFEKSAAQMVAVRLPQYA